MGEPHFLAEINQDSSEFPHTVLANHSNRAHFPLAVCSTEVSENSEELDHGDEKDIHEVAKIGQPIAILSLQKIYSSILLPRLIELNQNPQRVLLFILYHTWKSFLF